MTEKSRPPYKISCPQSELDRLKEWGRRAAALGLRDRFAEALEKVIQYLTTRPLDWGDPEYRLPAMALLMCHGIHPMLYVQYAVHEAERIVFIRQFRLVSDFLSEEEA